MIHKWVKACVPMPHWFFSTDRSKATGAWSHGREKARGIKKGEPDTHLLCPALPAVCIELKAPGNKPDEAQLFVGAAIVAAGHTWGWANSVASYCAALRNAGVPLNDRAEFWAQHYDAVLAAGVGPKKARAGRVSAPKPTLARVRKAEALRSRIRF